jgi:putative hydrolase of the HAD superfamily
MEITVAPDAIPGMDRALAELSRRYKLCVVSDAIVTPGRNLRKWLEMHALKDHFSGFAFRWAAQSPILKPLPRQHDSSVWSS